MIHYKSLFWKWFLYFELLVRVLLPGGHVSVQRFPLRIHLLRRIIHPRSLSPTSGASLLRKCQFFASFVRRFQFFASLKRKSLFLFMSAQLPLVELVILLRMFCVIEFVSNMVFGFLCWVRHLHLVLRAKLVCKLRVWMNSRFFAVSNVILTNKTELMLDSFFIFTIIQL